MLCNLFIVFVGPPGMGKFQALKEASLQPLHDLQDERDLPNTITEKCTSAALVKTVAHNEMVFVVPPTLFEVINKLFKSDEDNATGDVQPCANLSQEKVLCTVMPQNVPKKSHPMYHSPSWAQL